MNMFVLGGGVGKDVECRYLPSGTAVANISLATNTVFYDKDHKKIEKTEWHDITCFGNMAENAAKYITKGSKVSCVGEIQHRSWDATDGTKRYKTELVARNVEFVYLKPRDGEQDLPGKGHDRRLERKGFDQRDETAPRDGQAQDDPW